MMSYTVVDRFLKYVQYDTQSAEGTDKYPSTEGQKILGQELVRELIEMGLADAQMDEYGYVTATLPATTTRPVPTIGLIAHLDTSPDVSGKNVRPIVHRKYQGGDIVLPGDPTQIIRWAENPSLALQIGTDIITSDGTTLLGADNKAGIAEIFDAVNHLVQHPEIEHGRVRIAITPDEEVGQGTKYFDVKKFDADYAYTIDGQEVGEVEDETFCADTVFVTIYGKNIHPGYAKNKMINAMKIAGQLIAALPKDRLSPETTEGREGYIHPNTMTARVEQAEIKFLIRDFELEGLKQHEEFLKQLCDQIVADYPGAWFDFHVEESYRNMKYKLDEQPQVVENALEAIRRSGLTPRKNIVRGGTDGARLCYLGLLTPNIFTGGHNFHSKLEWISVRDMQKAVDVIINLIKIWAER
ncbi:MAG: peptidase T [candidate division KSB1 bacterium]|nr:peptidase T [candidate division KSB1 bacterium]MDZ7335118.1 peptidase T [candidate division KSB1 bacterium]MDZ7356613.1 peptidase T [candidate division KSB1 bacterium]MDZ7398967.1 peptidase T [candidate division KSB1 bacterium]